MNKRILIEHFAKVRDEFLDRSKHLGIVKHGTIKGDVREALISDFLKKNLPPIVDFITGEIIDSEDNKSGQVDIILQSNTDPRIALYENYHISFADSVLATIEVKSRLTTGKPDGSSSFNHALNTVRKIKELKRFIPIEHIYPFADKKNTIPSFIFSYSGPNISTLIKAIDEYVDFFEYDYNKGYRYLPEIIAVLDKGYFLFKDDGWIYSKDKTNETDPKVYRTFEIKDEVLIGIFSACPKIL